MNSLVGYTGFVGSNIYAKGEFDNVYNSKNIEEAYDTEPDLLVYAGLRAEKYLANNEPEKDMQLIYEAEENIRRIAPKKLVLISTVDVLKQPNGKDEDCEIETDGLQAYGANRYKLECWVRENYSDSVIIRLPGLFGKNIKKNFIYDYINIIPYMLKENKFFELSDKNEELKKYYSKQDNGFYCCKRLSDTETADLKKIFIELGFTALNFTDSRSVYQFYPLSRLWEDIQVCLKNDIRLFHPATEPVAASEVYEYLAGKTFENELNGCPVYYDFRTKNASLFGNRFKDYIMDKKTVLEEIKMFVEGR